jgi:ribonuclease HI
LNKIKVFTDGASRGNPGASAIGIIIYDENDIPIKRWNEYIGIATNNQAEYRALLKSLELVKQLIESGEHKFDTVEFYADSELMVKQIRGIYKIKQPELLILNKQFHSGIRQLGVKYSIHHVERALNKEADKLANQGIDNYGKL